MLTFPLDGQMMGEDGGAFFVADWTEPPAPADEIRWVAPLHLHRECCEAWVVLEGELIVRMNEIDFPVPAGGGFFVPAGAPHTYRNGGTVPARYLLIMTAKTKELIDAIHSAPSRDFASLREIFRQHDAELVG